MAWFTSCSGSDVDEALRREGWLIQISCFRYKYPANLFIERTLDRKYPPPGDPYSYFSVVTGSSFAARFAGNVPKMTPTRIAVTSEMIALHGEIGICRPVSRRTLSGRASPSSVPTSPPASDRNTLSVRN